MTENPIIDKIRKLRAMAEGTNNEAEAALFATKVSELLSAHGLSMADISEVDRDDSLEHEKFEMMYADPWRMSLFRSCCRLYFCDSFQDSWLDEKADKYRKGRTIIGRPHNVIICREMYQYLEATTLRLAKDYARNNPTMSETPRALRVGFERGCGVRLAQRLDELYRAQTASGAKRSDKGNPANLPALYEDEHKLVKNYMKQNFNLHTLKGRGSSVNRHGQEGMKAANKVSLNQQVQGSAGRLLK